MQDDDAGARLRAELRARRDAAGLSQRALADRVGYTREYVSRLESGGRLPSASLIERLDEALDAGGVLVDLRARAWHERQAPRQGLHAPTVEGADTDRRRFLTLAAVAAVAADTSRQMATADPDPLSLVEVEDDVDRFTAIYPTTPYGELVPQVEARWRQVDRALSGRTTLAARSRLTLAAGRLSYFLSRLGFGCGDFTSARRLAVLAEQYARQTGDEVVLGSVAGIMSGIAFYRGRYDVAVSVFDGYPPDPPYLAARNAAYRARAYGRLGAVDTARSELETMRRALDDAPARPGDLPLGEAASWMFTAATLAACGEGERAETYARRSIAAHEAAGPRSSREEWGHALLTLASSLLGRERPVVDEAAGAAARAVEVIDGQPVHTVLVRATDLAAGLYDHRRVPAVAALRERVATAPRLALPAGSR